MFFISTAAAWAPSTPTITISSKTKSSQMTCLNLVPREEVEESDTSKQEISENKTVEWGVSYIGGDPCGSIYNQDPFDNKPSKPGFPDDMKARIDALAREKRKQMEG